MKKRYLIGLILCCLMIIPLVGCSKKTDTTTPKVIPLTPEQIQNNRINASDTVDARQDQNITDLSNRITTEIAAVAHYNDAPIIARIVALEGSNTSTLPLNISDNSYITWLTTRITSLENLNIYARLNSLESLVGTFNTTIYPNISNRLLALETLNWSTMFTNISGLQNGNIVLGNRITTLETFNNSANISTRLANLEHLINTSPSHTIAPILKYPANGSVNIPAENVSLWWDYTLNTSHYEVWVAGLGIPSMPIVTNVGGYTLNLSTNASYSWRVVAIGQYENKSSEIWWFKTQ